MLPILVLVGRPNVGKSTLFNRLTRSRAALVADFPGLTRDRHYGRGRVGERRFIVVDTGGFEPVAKTGIMHAMAKQTRAQRRARRAEQERQGNGSDSRAVQRQAPVRAARAEPAAPTAERRLPGFSAARGIRCA